MQTYQDTLGTTLVVHLDDDYRFTRVEVGVLVDELRDPTALVARFDDAYSAAMDERATARAARSSVPRVPGTRTARRPALMSRPPLRDQTGTDPHWDLIRLAGASGPLDLAPTGHSRNECVEVRLDPASSRGRIVHLDAGWLAQATPARLESALVEAFENAYEKRSTP